MAGIDLQVFTEFLERLPVCRQWMNLLSRWREPVRASSYGSAMPQNGARWTPFMARRRHTPEQVVCELRESGTMLGEDKDLGEGVPASGGQ